VVRESENNTWLSLTIHEGRYRQVRRMCEAVGLTVVRLKRVRYGFLGLEGLKMGGYRFLAADEASRLLRMSRPGKGTAKSNPGSGEAKDRKKATTLQERSRKIRR